MTTKFWNKKKIVFVLQDWKSKRSIVLVYHQILFKFTSKFDNLFVLQFTKLIFNDYLPTHKISYMCFHFLFLLLLFSKPYILLGDLKTRCPSKFTKKFLWTLYKLHNKSKIDVLKNYSKKLYYSFNLSKYLETLFWKFLIFKIIKPNAFQTTINFEVIILRRKRY